MPKLHLVRRYRFCAAHRYHRPEWSEERNRQVFGACANPHGHGHNYRLELELGGKVDPETGFLVDLAALDDAVEAVLADFDHRHLNEDTPHFKESVPTTENLARVLWDLLGPRLPASLERLRLEEDEDLRVEITR
jgi:6-pyruvoyltetrahydropterin/6-carboxytetrahydropterin synthase